MGVGRPSSGLVKRASSLLHPSTSPSHDEETCGAPFTLGVSLRVHVWFMSPQRPRHTGVHACHHTCTPRPECVSAGVGVGVCVRARARVRAHIPAQ